MKYYVQSGPITKEARKIISDRRGLSNVVGISCVIDASDPYQACMKAAIHCEDLYDPSQNICDESGVYNFAEDCDFTEYSILYGPFFLVSEVGLVYHYDSILSKPLLEPSQYEILRFPDITSTLTDEANE